ncbi:hypothetical protein E3V36_07165 [Candidatus Marinimicrobia bacterium MT.SAG.2]|nr:hypothetical protein E3V36_07165 [Candidatus Marinimicrobia bacterium MT.SAG.2]
MLGAFGGNIWKLIKVITEKSSLPEADKEITEKGRTATIMFIDLIGSSEVASIKSLNYYRNIYLKQFHDTINTVLENHDVPDEADSDEEVIWHMRGDELFILLSGKSIKTASDEQKINKIRSDILRMFSIALDIKYRWLFNDECGIKRLKGMKAPFEIAIGINTGQVLITKEKGNWGAEGYAINLAKRIESESRKGSASNIFVSENTYGYYSDISGENVLRFEQQEKSVLKGISGIVRIYELIFANLDEDDAIVKIPSEWLVDWDEKKEDLYAIEKMFLSTLNPWLGNVLCNVHWRKGAESLENLDELNGIPVGDDINVIKKKSLRKEAEQHVRKASEIARKLIEIEPENPAWKIYLAQILHEYLYYDLTEYNDKSVDKERVRLLLYDDTVKLLKKLTKDKPEEVDAWLYLSRIYLEIEINRKLIDAVIPNYEGFSDRKREKSLDDAMNFLSRIIMWDVEYPEAYYYMAAGYLAQGAGKTKIMEVFKKALRYADMQKRKPDMIKLAIIDPLFSTMTSVIKAQFGRYIKK